MELPLVPSTKTRGLSFFARLASATLIIAILWLGKPVVVPIILAFILAFILTTPLKALLRLGLPRIGSLALVMVLALGIVTGFGAFLVMQVNELADKVEEYSDSMRKRVVALQLGTSGPLSRLETTFERVTSGMERIGPHVETVRTLPPQASPATRLVAVVSPFAEPLAAVVIVFVLTFFFLSQREDLRNRLIRLAGPRNVTLTTRTLDEAGMRISRYLVAQTMINAGLGAFIALGLYLIGVPYAGLWGGLAAVLRFIPYLGPLAALALPATLAFAIFPGWQQVVLTVLLFAGLDAVTAYFIEPVFIGHRTGVTAIALLISIVFWSWLWGPIGLVLSTPLTVSLAVLGRHLKPLRFLAVLLGDEEVLGPEVSYYQRLLAHDEDEASEIAQRMVATLSPVGVMDKVILPAMVLAAGERDRGEISDEDLAHVIEASRENVMLLRGGAPEPRRSELVGIATGAESELLLQMVNVALPEQLGAIEVLSARGDLRELGVSRPSAVILAGLPPRSGTPARELCRRLKERFPNIRVIVLRPDSTAEEAARAAARFRAAGADAVVSTLAEAVNLLASAEVKSAA